MIPRLAQYYPSEFVKTPPESGGESFLHSSCMWLIELDQLAQQREGRRAFRVTLGKLAEACSSDYRPFLDATMAAAQNTLIMSQGNSDVDPTPVLRLIQSLASSMGPALTRYMHSTLDHMFATGLSSALCKALIALKREVNQLSVIIQDRLINEISMVLTRAPFRMEMATISDLERKLDVASLSPPLPPATPIKGSFSFGSADNGSPHENQNQLNTTIPTPQEIVLALNILGDFGFDRENMSVFIQLHILPYLNDEDTAIRLATISAISKVIQGDETYQNQGSSAIEVTNDITTLFDIRHGNRH